MLLWHALEESEHKAVAFDVYPRGRRHRAHAHLGDAVVNVSRSCWASSATPSPRCWATGPHTTRVRLGRSLAALRHSPFLTRGSSGACADYNRVGFHPDDNDNTELLERWRAELFGADGVLADHVR